MRVLDQPLDDVAKDGLAAVHDVPEGGKLEVAELHHVCLCRCAVDAAGCCSSYARRLAKGGDHLALPRQTGHVGGCKFVLCSSFALYNTVEVTCTGGERHPTLTRDESVKDWLSEIFASRAEKR